jgi:high-affinity iron transporter
MKIFGSNRKKNVLSVWILFVISSPFISPSFGQTPQLSSNDSILITLNTHRILEQMDLVQASLTTGDDIRAFEHAYITHSIIFPSIKDKLKEL